MYYIKCPYCFEEARKVNGSVVYPHRKDLHSRVFYFCDNGHSPAYVGTHKNGQPLGTLANSHLRKLRALAHHSFDNLWKSKQMSRTEAYSFLANKMNIKIERTHIGMFNEKQCREVLRIMAERNSF